MGDRPSNSREYKRKYKCLTIVQDDNVMGSSRWRLTAVG